MVNSPLFRSTATSMASALGLALLFSGCTLFTPAAPALRPTLAANTCKPTTVSQHTQTGTAFYKQNRMEEAKVEFLAAVSDGPKCAEAHYNLGLTLSYLGSKDEAREHFIVAANLAPGNQIIWDSPALRPYGDPQTEKKPKTAAEQAPGAFSNRGKGMGSGSGY